MSGLSGLRTFFTLGSQKSSKQESRVKEEGLDGPMKEAKASLESRLTENGHEIKFTSEANNKLVFKVTAGENDTPSRKVGASLRQAVDRLNEEFNVKKREGLFTLRKLPSSFSLSYELSFSKTEYESRDQAEELVAI